MSVVLEVSVSSRSTCRAGQDCFYCVHPRDDGYYSKQCAEIHDRFRIRVNSVRGEDDLSPSHWRTTHFYHVLCFVAMMDVEELIGSKNFYIRIRAGLGADGKEMANCTMEGSTWM